MFWHYAIADVGAGLSTVLGNLQVVVVPFAAWAVLGERVQARLLAALPLVCSGVVLISGVLETGAYGDNPLRGVVVRHPHRAHLRRASCSCCGRAAPTCAGRPARCSTPRPSPRWWPRSPASPSARSTSCRPGRRTAGSSLLALTSQVLGWLLITVSLPRLPAALTSVTLTIQPVGSVLLGVILLGEDPSALQLAGVACILAGLVSVALRRDPARRPVPEPA